MERWRERGCHTSGRCWVAVRGEGDGAVWVEGGVVGEASCKSIGHLLSPDGSIRRVAFRKRQRQPSRLPSLQCKYGEIATDAAEPAAAAALDASGRAYWLVHEPGTPLEALPAAAAATAAALPRGRALLLTLPQELSPRRAHSDAAPRVGVGTRLLLEDERVAIWEFRLAPGEACAYHTHTRPYAFVNLEASLTQALAPDGGAVGEPAYQEEGQVTFVAHDQLSSHGVRNVGEQTFVQFVVEFK